jgi:hypothetical protein
VGVNFYSDNQWTLGGSTVGFGHHLYRPFRSMLAEVHDRYGRPVLVAETGAEGTARAAWLHYVASEVRAALEDGVPVEGICLYPSWTIRAGRTSAPARSGSSARPTRTADGAPTGRWPTSSGASRNSWPRRAGSGLALGW